MHRIGGRNKEARRNPEWIGKPQWREDLKWIGDPEWRRDLKWIGAGDCVVGPARF